MRIVDLTMTYPDVPVYPGHPEVKTTKLTSFGVDGKEISRLDLGTHSGTHIDAPRHYIEGGATVENIPLDVLCGPASLVNLSFLNPSGVTYADIVANAGFVEEDRILFRFDGEKRLGDMAYYRDQPWLTEEVAQWLINRGCKLIGLDTPMPDAWANIDTMPIHKMLLGAGIVIVEYLVNLSAIKSDTFDLIVAPLKIREGDGAPARCFAICP